MFYYAQIDSEYQVISVHALTEVSTEENYISITEEQYNDSTLVGQYYNSLHDRFEIIDYMDYMGDSPYMKHDHTEMRLSTKIDNMQVEIYSKADENHTHTEYASSDDLTVLEDAITTKANASHIHTGYADTNHAHNEYATVVALDALGDELNNKADSNHTHSDYASVSHEHNSYATQISVDSLEEVVSGKASASHNHDTTYAGINHNHNGVYSDAAHNHNETYSAINHNHDNVYAEITVVDEIADDLATKADSIHTHNDIYYTETEVDTKLTDKANSTHSHTNYALSTHAHDDYADVNHNHDSSYATVSHSHSNYVTTTDFSTLETEVDGKANASHSHSNYSLSTHEHDNYATKTELDALTEVVDGKANTNHTHNYASATHTHTAADVGAATSGHNHDTDYADINHNHNVAYAGIEHDHDENYAAIGHAHTNYATTTALDELSTTVSGKANSSHSHDGRYYTETEINTKLADKSDATHNHTGVYDANGAAANALSSANTYTDEAIDNLSETVATKANSSALNSHTGNTTIHITSTERTNWNAAKNHADSAHAPTTNATQDSSGLMSKTDKTKLDGIAEGANNYTLPSAGSTLGGVKSGGDVTISAGVITVNDDSHNHTIANIDGLQTALNGKSASGHNHDGSYYTETEMDEILEGKANTSHTHTIANVTNLQSALDGKAATSHGAHVSYSTTTPVMDGSASVGTASTVARSDHKHPTDTSRAAKADLDTLTQTVSGKANSSHTHTIANVTNLQTTLDGKAASSHNHSASNINSGTLSSDRLPTVPVSKGGTGATTAAAALTNLGLTATATELNKMDGVTVTTAELNYVDGVTSNIQTQLNNLNTKIDGKAASSHNHAATNITSGTLSSDRLPTIPISKGGTGSTTAAGALTNLGITATSTELNYVDGVTSNIQTQLNNKSASNHTHNYAGSSSAGGSATSATKLATARTIGLGTGVTGTATSFNGSANITIPVTAIKESYLTWGGRNLSGSVSPIDAASSNVHSANRFSFAKPAGITVEYSTNGSTYSAYSTTDTAKINLVSGVGNTYYIGARSSSTTVNDKLRITLNATNMGVYTRLRKLLINISTGYSTGSNVIIEKAMKGSETTFSTVGTYPISGWSGWNSIPVECAFGGGNTQTGNVAVLRLTFGITGVNVNQTSNALQIIDIVGIGDTYWSYPSTMAKTGHLYAYDGSQNATFPAKVTATTYSGATYSGSGVATVAEVETYLGI